MPTKSEVAKASIDANQQRAEKAQPWPYMRRLKGGYKFRWLIRQVADANAEEAPKA